MSTIYDKLIASEKQATSNTKQGSPYFSAHTLMRLLELWRRLLAYVMNALLKWDVFYCNTDNHKVTVEQPAL